jgi:serine/threonine protein kinase/peptidoglycan hydrolase-like protein with peptidoglycan-binding domain
VDETKSGNTPGGAVTTKGGSDGTAAAADARLSENDFVALAPGKTIGRYEIVAVLGQGGFGITYRARDAQLNREVAIKEYLPTALAVRQGGVTVLPRSTKVAEDFGWGRQRFVEEGRTLASLQHAPAIVQVFDFLEANGTAYIVMRLVPGDTLESRLKQGTLGPAEVDRILWPLLDGLEQVHGTGFLHRDIKPANILLDSAGNPTLIDFGASRAAIAGRTTAMTAIFTPGYAAAEQMTSAKQGPWTDIYGVSATLYHAIVGAPPPSAFDRMLDDTYKPLAELVPEGFAPGLLVGIDAGLAVRATDRPQSIAGWRSILGQTGPLDSAATMAMAKGGDANATQVVRRPTVTPATAASAAAPAPAVARKRGVGLWIGLAAAALALSGGGYWWYTTNKQATELATVKEQAARAQAAQAQAELQKQRDAQARAEQVKRDAEIARQAEERAHQQFLNEQAAKEKADAEARAKAAADQAAKAQAEAADRTKAEATESSLHFSNVDRQHIQVALTALGYPTNGTDGVFGQKTRDMIAAWQSKRGDPGTGFLSGAQMQALQRDAGPAISKFDDEQKKTDEEKKRAEADAKAKAEADAKAKMAAAAATPPAAAANTASAAAPPGAAGPVDGHWRGTYQCSANKLAGEFTILLDLNIHGGTGTWVRPGSGPGTNGNQSVKILVTGKDAVLERLFYPIAGSPSAGILSSATLTARFEGSTITGAGREANSGGRHCNLNLTRG